jgi:hypothetical protein
MAGAVGFLTADPLQRGMGCPGLQQGASHRKVLIAEQRLDLLGCPATTKLAGESSSLTRHDLFHPRSPGLCFGRASTKPATSDQASGSYPACFCYSWPLARHRPGLWRKGADQQQPRKPGGSQGSAGDLPAWSRPCCSAERTYRCDQAWPLRLASAPHGASGPRPRGTGGAGPDPDAHPGRCSSG